MRTLFKDAEAEHFLARHWQRAAAFMPGALPHLPRVADWRVLTADEVVESRRVVTDAHGQYSLQHGPFADTDPGDPWTVLIQDADHHWPALKALIDAVDFLPRWRVEDIMMSVATRGASVGPHVDAYDVFLVQVEGERRWEIGETGAYEPDDRVQDLRLVQPFAVSQAFTATPGDVLYLPPDVPHHGVALGNCVTYSIGFRAPALHDLAAVALGELTSGQRYRDEGTARATDPTMIDAQVLSQLRTQMRSFLDLEDATLASALGELMTEPKPWLIDDTAPSPALHPTASPLRIRLVRGARIARYVEPGIARLFANGQAYAIEHLTDTQWLAELGTQRDTVCPAHADCLTLAQALLDDHVIELQS